MKGALKPEAHWGPALDEDRVGPRYAPLKEPGFDADDDGHYPTKMTSQVNNYNNGKASAYVVGNENQGYYAGEKM